MMSEDQLEDALIGLVVRGAVAIPPYPAVALKLANVVSSGNYGLSELTKLIGQDQALAADVLRCANSSYYARGAEVTSLGQAVARIGSKEIAAIALASGLSRAASGDGPLHALKRETWQRAVAGALVCQVIAGARGLATEDAFPCGLLHDFGAIIAISALEELLAQRPEERARDKAAWRRVIERVHVELGSLMATRWRLPQLLADVISLHHEREYWHSPHSAMIDVVVASDAVLHLLREHASVSPEALAGHVRPEEREAVARALPDLPALIASFDRPVAPVALPSKVLPPPPSLPQGFRKLELKVEQLKPHAHGVYKTKGIAQKSFLITGDKPMPPSSLVELRIDAPEPLTLWATVASSTSGDGAHTIECNCFALNGPTLSRWNDLYRSAAAVA
jgi:HD-like signal output (HDOD) protein